MSLITGPSTAGDPAQTPGALKSLPSCGRRQREQHPGAGVPGPRWAGAAGAAPRCRGRTRSSRGGAPGWQFGACSGRTQGFIHSSPLQGALVHAACFGSENYCESGLADTPVSAGSRRVIALRSPAVTVIPGIPRGVHLHPATAGHKNGAPCDRLSLPGSHSLTLPESIKRRITWQPKSA